MKRIYAVLMCLVLCTFAANSFALLEPPPEYVPPDLDNLVVFGDSLSDTGNVFTASLGTEPSGATHWLGRWSNGPVWSENMAKQMGILDSFLLMQMLGGLDVPDTTPLFFNNAFGGANTGAEESHFSWQIDQWQDANLQVAADSLVVVWIGANDFLGMGNADPNVVVATAIQNIGQGLADLAALGATHIAVCNLPNLGATPLNIGTDNEVPATQLTIGFNQALAATVAGFAAGFQGTVYEIDVFAMFEEAQANPAKFGVTNVEDGALLVGKDFESADDYLFWDTVHPTRVAHEQIAALVYGQIFIGADADYIKTQGATGGIIGITGDTGDINAIDFVDPENTQNTDRPENFLYGIMDITMTLNALEDTAEITIYLPEALPTSYSWYKHINGQWVDFAQVFKDTNGAQGAEISADRKQVVLHILDNGQYDADKTAGVVQDPIAAALFDPDPPAVGDSDDDCFVQSLQATAPQAWLLILMGSLALIGGAFRRK